MRVYNVRHRVKEFGAKKIPKGLMIEDVDHREWFAQPAPRRVDQAVFAYIFTCIEKVKLFLFTPSPPKKK